MTHSSQLYLFAFSLQSVCILTYFPDKASLLVTQLDSAQLTAVVTTRIFLFCCTLLTFATTTNSYALHVAFYQYRQQHRHQHHHYHHSFKRDGDGDTDCESDSDSASKQPKPHSRCDSERRRVVGDGWVSVPAKHTAGSFRSKYAQHVQLTRTGMHSVTIGRDCCLATWMPAQQRYIRTATLTLISVMICTRFCHNLHTCAHVWWMLSKCCCKCEQY